MANTPKKSITELSKQNGFSKVDTIEFIVDTCNSGLRNFLIISDMIEAADKSKSSITKFVITSPVTIELERGNKIFPELIRDEIKKSLKKDYKEMGATSKFYKNLKDSEQSVKLNFKETNVGRSIKMLYLMSFENIFNKKTFKNKIDPAKVKKNIIKKAKHSMECSSFKETRKLVNKTDFDTEFNNLVTLATSFGSQYKILFKKQKDEILKKYKKEERDNNKKIAKLRTHKAGYSKEIKKLKKALKGDEAQNSKEVRDLLKQQLAIVKNKKEDSISKVNAYYNQIQNLERKNSEIDSRRSEEIDKKKVNLLSHYSKEIFNNMGTESKYIFQEMFDNVNMRDLIRGNDGFKNFTADKGEDAVVEIMVKRGKGNKKNFFTIVISNDGPAREKIDALRDKSGKKIFVISDYGLEIIAKKLNIEESVKEKLKNSGEQYKDRYSDNIFKGGIHNLDKSLEKKYALKINNFLITPPNLDISNSL